MAHVATITIDHTKVAGDLTDYVGFIAPDASAGYSALYALCLEGGGDIRLFKSDDTTELAREIVTFSVSAETGEIHYRYTGTLSSSVDTAIHVYADGSSSEPSAGSTYGAQNVWSEYLAVLHLGEAVNNTTDGYLDSTGNGYDGTGNSMSLSAPSGKLSGRAQSFDGSASYIKLTDGVIAATQATSTVSVWFKTTFASKVGGVAMYAERAATGLNIYKLDYGDDGSPREPFLTWRNDAGTLRFIKPSASTSYSDDVWHHNAFVINGNAITIYINSSNQASGSLSTKSFTNSGLESRIGGDKASTTANWDGELDEFRIASVARSADWATTEYNNQNSYSTFYSVAAVSGGSATHVATITIDHTKVAGDLTDYVGFIAPDASAGYSALYALCLEGGGDIRLFKSDDTTELAREIVSFSVSAETGEIHYRYAGTLSSSVDTAIHVYADGSSSEPSAGATYGSEAVWADYGLVSHDGGATDSTGNNSITANGSISSGATGKIGIGTDFPGGSTDYYNAPANSSYGAVGTSSVSITVSSWFKRTSAQNRFAALFRFGNDAQYFLQFQDAGGTNLVFGIKDIDRVTKISGEVVTGTGAFEYYVGVADHVADVISLYKNGSLGASNSTTVSFRAGSNLLLIGQQSVGLSRILDGIADEMRISKTANSATWIETEYNNQNSYSTFYSVAAVGGGSAAQAARRGAVMMM